MTRLSEPNLNILSVRKFRKSLALFSQDVRIPTVLHG
ncbi:uncharacterized protein METZ01_LOCUS421217, partial [marine metagenome]